MAISEQMKLIISFLVCSNVWVSIIECKNKTENEKDAEIKGKNEPVSVNSRFFDLGGILNQLFPNFNQGQAGNSGTNFPQNSQTYPGGGEYQGNYYPPSNEGNYQPYPDQGSQNQGFTPQEFYNTPNQWQAQYPDQGGNNRPSNYPGRPNNQYPINNQNGMTNQGNWRPNYNEQANQYLNQGRPSQSPISNGMHTHVQLPPNLPQNWNQQRPIQDPNSGRPLNYPNQGGEQPPHNDGINNPTVNNIYPGSNPSRPDQGFNQQNPDQYQGQNQAGFQNLNNGNQNGGSLDDFAPQYNNGTENMNAVLGKPVKVASSTFSPDQIVFEDSSESPLQTQCVQDCPSTSEYNPVCGTNNVTYFNPGKFVCARNCGIKVYVTRRGVCQRRPM